MKAFVFPGQGAQFVGMGKELYETNGLAKEYFEKANDILGYRISDIMFDGTDDQLKETKVTQPAIFLHSTILAMVKKEEFTPDMVAGHSLGEFSALVATGALSFQDGLRLVYTRAMAMQKACEIKPSTMAAVLGLENEVVEDVCKEVEGVVVAANYNCPGQIVISGEVEAIEQACEVLKEKGARRALVLKVGGAFHSPLMAPAKDELMGGIEKASFKQPSCPIYQNVSAKPERDADVIKKNLIEQLTAPVKWTHIMGQMQHDGLTEVIEVGPGKVLQGLFKKMDRSLPTQSL